MALFVGRVICSGDDSAASLCSAKAPVAKNRRKPSANARSANPFRERFLFFDPFSPHDNQQVM